MKHRKRLIQYFVLAAVLLALLSIGWLSASEQVRFLVSLACCIIYFAYGILHHYEEKDLSEKVLLEYLAISLLAFLALYSFFV